MSYEVIKKFVQEHRREFNMLAALVVVFFAGVGTGKLGQKAPASTNANYSNYSTKTTEAAPKEQPVTKPEERGEVQPVVAQPAAAPVAAAAAVAGATTECKVKGNISTKEKIYHIPGGSSYERVKPEQCFATEEEAKAAGFRKAAR